MASSKVNTHILRRIAGLSALALCLSCAAQDRGYWYAASSTAQSITSDIALSDNTIKINLTAIPMQRVRTLAPAEVSAAFDADVNSGVKGALYRLNVPASRHFVHHNTLCGSEDTQWMATYAIERRLQVAFFSGSEPPVFTLDALRNSTDLCGTFSYSR
jgi:hypothetical protein